MDAPNIYHYHPDTGELTGMGFADPSPLEEGVWLVPGSATKITPVDVPAGHAAVFDEQSQTWSTVVDHRGETWWKDGHPFTITILGDPTLEGFSSEGPPEVGEKETPVWNSDESEWVIVADHRGETWWSDHETPVLITELGDPSTLGLFPERPEPEEPEEPEPEPEPEPEEPEPNDINLPRREFRLALLRNGMDTASVVGVIEGIEDPIEREEMMIWWEDTQFFERFHPHLVAMTGAAGLNAAQADAIWEYGVGILNGTNPA